MMPSQQDNQGVQNQLEYNNQPVTEDTFLKAKSMDIESGILGRFFGSKDNGPINISGFIAVILVSTAVAITFLEPDKINSVWGIITPLLTLILGYLFGKKGE